MRINEIRKTLHAQPFRPFSVRVADGREYHVDHPDFIALDPTGRLVVVFQKNGTHEVVDAMMIASLHVGNGRRPRSRRS